MQHRQKSGSSLGVAAPLLLEGGDEEDDPANDPVPTAAATNIKLVAVVSVMVVLLGVSDRIAYKVMLVPMTNYPFAVSFISSVFYVLIYGPILVWQSRLYKFSLLQPLKRFWKLFILMGLLDGLGDSLGLVGARHISGALLTLLPKVIIPMSMLFSALILKIRYTWQEAAAACVVLGGVSIALVPDLSQGLSTGDPASKQLLSIIIYLVSVAPSALSFVLKELVFRRQPGLNVFVVSFYGSFFELCVTVLLVPMSAIPGLGHVPLAELPGYLGRGIQCWAGVAAPGNACIGDPYATLVYHAFNLSWNIAMIILLKLAGATLLWLVNTLKFPIANLMFYFRWPLLHGDPRALSWSNILGLCVEFSGVACFQWATRRRELGLLQRKQALERKRSVSRNATLDSAIFDNSSA